MHKQNNNINKKSMNTHPDIPRLLCLFGPAWVFFNCLLDLPTLISHAQTLCAFIFFHNFCQYIPPQASITLMLGKGPRLIIDFQRSIWFSSTNPLAPQVFQQTIFPFLWSNHICGICTRWATADTVLRALVFLCIQDTLPSMCGSQPALNDPKVTAAVAHPCCLYQ